MLQQLKGLVRTYDAVRGSTIQLTATDIITDIITYAHLNRFKRVRPNILEQPPDCVIAEYLSIKDSVYLNHMIREAPAVRYMRALIPSMSVDPYVRVLDLDTGEIEIQRSRYVFMNIRIPENSDIVELERSGKLSRIEPKYDWLMTLYGINATTIYACSTMIDNAALMRYLHSTSLYTERAMMLYELFKHSPIEEVWTETHAAFFAVCNPHLYSDVAKIVFDYIF
jgi:hypothetical protein